MTKAQIVEELRKLLGSHGCECMVGDAAKWLESQLGVRPIVGLGGVRADVAVIMNAERQRVIQLNDLAERLFIAHSSFELAKCQQHM